MASTIRVSEHAHEVLKLLSDRQGISMVEALDVLAENWERAQFFQSLNESFAALKADPDAWQEELEERQMWDNALLDNLTEDNQNAPQTKRRRNLAGTT